MLKSLLALLFLWIGYECSASDVGCVPTKEELAGVQQFPLFDRDTNVSLERRFSWAPLALSDPMRHDSSSYRYLIHTINNFGIRYTATSSFHFIGNTVANNPCATISTSLVNQQKRAMFGTMGFILRVPSENILFTSPQDIGSPNLYTNIDPVKFHTELRRFQSRSKHLQFLTPDEVLTDSDENRWNEVLVQAKVHEAVQIVGIFISNSNITYGGVEKSAALIKELRELAAQHNLPVIHLTAQPDRLKSFP